MDDELVHWWFVRGATLAAHVRREWTVLIRSHAVGVPEPRLLHDF